MPIQKLTPKKSLFRNRILSIGILLLFLGCSSNNGKIKDRIKPLQQEVLSEGEEATKAADNCRSHLRQATISKDLIALEQLLEAGCDVNEKFKVESGYLTSPLGYGIVDDDVELIKFFLEKGADVNQNKGILRSSPFHFAAGTSSAEILQLLIDKGGEVNTYNSKIDAYYSTPLLMAIQNRKNENAKLLIKYGAFIDPHPQKGPYSPLGIAIYNLNTEMVEALLEKGANVDAKFTDASGDCITCPWDITVMHQIAASYSGYKGEKHEKVKYYLNLLLKNKPDLNLTSEMGFTPLDHACFGEDTNLVNKLIYHGAKIETEDRSALHAAVMFSSVHVTKHLLMKGANPNRKNNRQYTPLMICYYGPGDGLGDGIKDEDKIATIELLLDYGADIHVKNRNGKSFHDIIMEQHEFEIRKKVFEMMTKRGLISE